MLQRVRQNNFSMPSRCGFLEKKKEAALRVQPVGVQSSLFRLQISALVLLSSSGVECMEAKSDAVIKDMELLERVQSRATKMI